MDGGSPVPSNPFVYTPKKEGGFMDPIRTTELMEVEAGSTLADFGCGAGYLTFPLAKTIGDQGRVYAIDVLEGALEHIASRARLENIRNIIPVRANLEHVGTTGIDDASVDTVVISNILFQTDAPEHVLSEAYRILKPSGRLIVIDWRPDNAPMRMGRKNRSAEEMTAFVRENRFVLAREFAPGETHYGLVFQKE